MTTPSGPYLPVIDLTACARPRTVVGHGAASGQLYTGPGLLIACTFANTVTTTPARFSLHDGTDISGQAISILSAPAAGGGSLSIAPPGIYFADGIWLNADVGFMVVTATVIPLPYQL
jgi:hypothetical protein